MIPPEPVENIDYYHDALKRYTVVITIEVNGLDNSQSREEVCSNAVEGFRHGTQDGDAEIVNSELIKHVCLDMKTNKMFNLKKWQEDAMLKTGFKPDGTPLRPSDKKRPKSETTLDGFKCGVAVQAKSTWAIGFNNVQ